MTPRWLLDQQLQELTWNGWPLPMATDGGMTPSINQKGALVMVVFYLPSIPFKCFMKGTKEEHQKILDEDLMPYIIRGMLLPDNIGSISIDNDHAECIVFIVMDEM